MKLQILKLAMILVPISLTACVETTAPLCGTGNLVDVPGLERTYTAAVTFDPSQGVNQQQLTFIRSGLGHYQVGGEDLATCKVGNWTVLESKSESGYYSQSIVSVDRLAGTTFSQLILNSNDLLSGGVVFHFEDRPNGNVAAKIKSRVDLHSALGLSLLQNSGTTNKVLVIENKTSQDRDVIAKAAKPNAFGLTLY